MLVGLRQVQTQVEAEPKAYCRAHQQYSRRYICYGLTFRSEMNFGLGVQFDVAKEQQRVQSGRSRPAQQANTGGLESRGHMRPLSVIILAGAASTPALSTLAGKRSLELILDAAGSCRRLLPLAQSVHVVLPAAAATQAGPELQGYGLSSANVIASGGDGDVDDLRLALKATGLKHHVVVISANRLTLAPGYNFQRLVEHGLTRDADAVGLQELGLVEYELLGYSGHTVGHTYDPPQLVPPISSLQFVDSDMAEDGMWALQPLLFLTPATLAGGVLEASRAPDLIALAVELFNSHGKTQLHALSLGPGLLHTSNPAALKYADKCVSHLLPLVPAKPDQDTLSEAAKAALPNTAHSLPTMEQLLTTFNNQFFGLSKSGVKDVVPDTFFMTAYRRQAADLLR